MDCENCRHLTVVGLHDTGPRSLTKTTMDKLETRQRATKRKLLEIKLKQRTSNTTVRQRTKVTVTAEHVTLKKRKE